MPGFTVERVNELIGLDNMLNGHLDLYEVAVPLENRIGEEGQGWQLMVEGLNYERVLTATQAVAGITEAIKAVIPYAQRRVQFGKPTIELPTNQFKIAEMIKKLKLARLSAYYAAYLLDLGLNREAAVDCSVSKLFSCDMMTEIGLEAVQLLGGDGVTKFYPVERVIREGKILQIAGGTSEAMKLIIFRMGIREIIDKLRMPNQARHAQLGAPDVNVKSRVDEDSLLEVLAEDYRVNPGLHMSREDLKDRFAVDDKEIDKVLISLEQKKLVTLFRRDNEIELAKATYQGLRKAHPPKHYQWFPTWADKDNLF